MLVDRSLDLVILFPLRWLSDLLAAFVGNAEGPTEIRPPCSNSACESHLHAHIHALSQSASSPTSIENNTQPPSPSEQPQRINWLLPLCCVFRSLHRLPCCHSKQDVLNLMGATRDSTPVIFQSFLMFFHFLQCIRLSLILSGASHGF